MKKIRVSKINLESVRKLHSLGYDVEITSVSENTNKPALTKPNTKFDRQFRPELFVCSCGFNHKCKRHDVIE